MRTAYEIVQQLMWDSNFRNLFIDDRRAALASYYPDYEDEGLFGETALVQGLEEEAYRRIASLQRTSKDVFPCSHHLLLAYLGNEFFEDLLRRFFELRDAEHYPSGALDILEPFDSYIVAPMILATAQESTPSELVWLNSLLKYEWALWQARRVASGWPPLTNHAPLVPGASLVDANFDLKSLVKEAKRLEGCSVAAELYRWRIHPGAGSYYAAIYPKDGNVLEAKLDVNSYTNLSSTLGQNPCQLNEELRDTVQSIGLVLATSFLCCSNEAAEANSLESSIPALVEPEPH